MFCVAACPHSNQHDPWMARPVADTFMAAGPLPPEVTISSTDGPAPETMTVPALQEAATEDALDMAEDKMTGR